MLLDVRIFSKRFFFGGTRPRPPSDNVLIDIPASSRTTTRHLFSETIHTSKIRIEGRFCRRGCVRSCGSAEEREIEKTMQKGRHDSCMLE